MTIQEAVEILRIHNEWRRGAEDIQPYAPSVIGEAIDVVVNYHGQHVFFGLDNAVSAIREEELCVK